MSNNHIRPKDVQTEIKHKILELYLPAWGNIILNGLRRRALEHHTQRQTGYPLRFIYVDAFANVGRYAGTRIEEIQRKPPTPLPGSPIIGIRAMDNLAKHGVPFQVTTNAILIEANTQVYRLLHQTLIDEGYGDRIRETTNFESLAPGEIALVHGDAVRLQSLLLGFTNKPYRWSFYLLDPWGAKGIPYQFVKAIVSAPHTDVMINLIYNDLHRKTGATDEMQPKHKGNWDDAYGTRVWREIVDEIEGQRAYRDVMVQHEYYGTPPDIEYHEWDEPFDEVKYYITDPNLTEILELRLVNLYYQRLLGMDSSLAIKQVRLRYPNQERTLFYLFLTTHDGTGALKLNEILHSTKYIEEDLRYKRWFAEETKPNPIQPALFDTSMAILEPEQTEVKRPTKEECAIKIRDILKGQCLTRREAYKQIADEIFFESEITSAFKYLKKQGLLNFEGQLSNKTELTFLP